MLDATHQIFEGDKFTKVTDNDRKVVWVDATNHDRCVTVFETRIIVTDCSNNGKVEMEIIRKFQTGWVSRFHGVGWQSVEATDWLFDTTEMVLAEVKRIDI